MTREDAISYLVTRSGLECGLRLYRARERNTEDLALAQLHAESARDAAETLGAAEAFRTAMRATAWGTTEIYPR